MCKIATGCVFLSSLLLYGVDKLEYLRACQNGSLASVTARLILSSSPPPSHLSPLPFITPLLQSWSSLGQIFTVIHWSDRIDLWLAPNQTGCWVKVWLSLLCESNSNILGDFSPLDLWLKRLAQNKTVGRYLWSETSAARFLMLEISWVFFTFWLRKFTQFIHAFRNSKDTHLQASVCVGRRKKWRF